MGLGKSINLYSTLCCVSSAWGDGMLLGFHERSEKQQTGAMSKMDVLKRLCPFLIAPPFTHYHQLWGEADCRSWLSFLCL